MSEEKKRSYKFNYEELSGICFQLAMVLRSGIRMYDGLEAMCSVRDRTSGAHEILLGMAEDLRQYTRLCDAMRKTGAFPPYMIGMVELGENSGRLEEVMTSLSGHFKREERLRGTIFGAVFYPAVLCVMICAVIIALMTRVLPEFSRVLEDMGIETSASIRTLISIGGGGLQYILLIVLIIFVAAGGFIIYSKISGKGYTFRDILFKIPLLRRISDKISAGQFASAMALAISSGYEIDEAFALLGTIITNRRALKKIRLVGENVTVGGSFSQAVVMSGIFDGMPERMVAVGEKTGNVGEVMQEISNIYEDETSIALNNLVSTIEPVMVAFLAVVTGMIMLVIMLPLLGIISAMS